jgi:molybdopterin-guanine dinucleotide biosynthesis protein A
MGRDKAGVVFDGEPLLVRAAKRFSEVFPEVLVVGGGDGRDQVGLDALPGLRLLADEVRGLGPLGGIATALEAASHAWVFVAACDMPFVTDDRTDEGLIARLWQGARSSPRAPAIAPRLGGRAQPLAALYNKSALGAVREAARGDRLCMWRVLEEIGASYVEIDPGSAESRALVDLDTEDDVARAERLLAQRKGN